MMKIVYFNYLRDAIGPIIRTLELAKGCSESGVDVVVYFLHADFSPPEFVYDRIRSYQGKNLRIEFRDATGRTPAATAIAENAKLNSSPGEPRMRLLGLAKQALLSLLHVREEIRILRKERPDAVVARPDHSFSFCFSTRFLKIPYVLEADGPIEELDLYWGISSKWFKPLDTFRAERARSVSVISRVCADLMTSKISNPEKIFIVPNGTHINEFAPSSPEIRQTLRERLGLAGCRVIGYSGNQRVWHGLPNLLRAALPLLLQDSRMKILIIGCGFDPSLMEKCGIPQDVFSEQIVFTGRLSYWDMASHIDLADLMVMPYEEIPLFYFSPMRMFEAMSVGKSLITSRQGQMSDLLDSRASVRFFDPADPKSLGDVLADAIRDDAFIGDGTKNRLYLERQHTWTIRGQTLRAAIEYATGINPKQRT
jgi:glycosyltransferase involved in cell wall biosynthesis